MSMDHEHVLRHPDCIGCDEPVDPNGPEYLMDIYRGEWHRNCYENWLSSQEDQEPDYNYTRYEDSASYRQSMTDAGRGHLLP